MLQRPYRHRQVNELMLKVCSIDGTDYTTLAVKLDYGNCQLR